MDVPHAIPPQTASHVLILASLLVLESAQVALIHVPPATQLVLANLASVDSISSKEFVNEHALQVHLLKTISVFVNQA